MKITIDAEEALNFYESLVDSAQRLYNAGELPLYNVFKQLAEDYRQVCKLDEIGLQDEP